MSLPAPMDASYRNTWEYSFFPERFEEQTRKLNQVAQDNINPEAYLADDEASDVEADKSVNDSVAITILKIIGTVIFIFLIIAAIAMVVVLL